MDGMKVDSESLRSHLVKSVISSMGGAFLVCVGLFIAFYYNTNNEVKNNKEKIENITTVQDNQAKQINEIQVEASGSNATLKSLDTRTINIEQRVNSIDSKTEGIYNILIEEKNKNR